MRTTLTSLLAGPPQFGLFMETEREYSCLLPLDVKLESAPGRLTAEIRGIGKTELCLTAVGPASFRTIVALTEGPQVLRITRGSLTDEYAVTITPAAIEVEPLRASFTRPEHTRAWRYPPDSFAHVCNAGGGMEAACARFDAILQDDVGARPFTFAEDGAIPYPTASAGFRLDWRVTYYRYDAPEDFARAGTRLRVFMEENPDLSLYLVNWKNEAYRSWLGGA
jgi:hypothetical protein